jgi:BioD-like phosphotransacetylase family protein
MKSLYITSVEPYSGKTAVCLSLGRYLQGRKLKVGYLKPVSTQPWRMPDGTLADEDAVFVHSALGLEGDPVDSSPIIVTPTTLRAHLQDLQSDNLIETIQDAAKQAGAGKDILLLEGGASLREGYAIGLSNLRVAEVLGAPALVLVPYRGEMRLVDDGLTARFRLGEQLFGTIINRVPEDGVDFTNEYALPFLDKKGIRCFGTIPSVPRLSALSVGELIELLDAQVLTKSVNPEALAETLTIGAMTAEAALSRFRRYQNKAVITGGDRTDIQLAALETSTVVMILTGNLHPSPLIIEQAETMNVPILLVKQNTMETIEIVEGSMGRTRLGLPEKMETFLNLMKDHVRLDEICSELGLC